MLRCAPAGSELGTVDSMRLLNFAVHIDFSRATSACCSYYQHVYGILVNCVRPRHAGCVHKPITPGMEAYRLVLTATAYGQL